MEQPQYTLAGVMNFLRTEWQHREQTRIEWDIERADMQNRIRRLETEKLELLRERDEARRHLDILFSQKLSYKQNGKVQQESSPTEVEQKNKEGAASGGGGGHTETRRAETEAGSEPAATMDSAINPEIETASNGASQTNTDFSELDESQEVSDSLMSTVNDSRDYLKQCIADIRHILRQTGVGNLEAEPLIMPHPALKSNNITTLANFGSAALTVVMLPDNRIAAGTADGNLLIWESGAMVPRKFAENPHPVNCIQYSKAGDRIVVAVGSSLQVYTAAEVVPQLITSQDLGNNIPVVQIAAAPNGNLLSAVQANGVSTVWSLKGGTELVKMNEPLNSVRVCDFAEAGGDLHLVLARDPESTDPSSPEGNLLLADPLTGQLLKKIVFASNAVISALLLTQDVIVLGTDSGDLRVLDLNRGETLAEVTAAHRGRITSLSLLNGGSVMSTSIDGRVSIWSIPSLLWKGRMLSHDSGYGALCSSSNGGIVAVGGGDGIIRVYKE